MLWLAIKLKLMIKINLVKNKFKLKKGVVTNEI